MNSHFTGLSSSPNLPHEATEGENLVCFFADDLYLFVGRTNQPGCCDAANQARRVSVGAGRVQAIAVVVAFDQGPVAGVCV